MIFSKRRVLYEERLKITARENRRRERFILKKERGMAISAKTTGTKVRIVLPRISLLVISGFFMCSEYKTYLRIQYRVRPIKVICMPKIITDSSFLLNSPKMLAENGTKLMSIKNKALIFVSLESMFFA